jgi:hypothetical protein
MSETPYTIRTILRHLGPGLSGALVYVGASKQNFTCVHTGPSNPGFICPERDVEQRPSKPSKVALDGGVSYEVGLMFAVNGKRGADWRMLITYEPNDTYSVYLSRKAKPSEKALCRVILASASLVYGDNLQHVVETMYDDAIRKHNSGFIPV